MKANVGGIDRTLRILFGLALLAGFFFTEGDSRYWGLFGIVPLFTGLVRWCPFYPLLGLSTCPACRN